MAPLERYTLFVDLHPGRGKTTVQSLTQANRSLELVRVSSVAEAQTCLAQHPPQLLLMAMRPSDRPADFLRDYRQTTSDQAPLMLAIADLPAPPHSPRAPQFAPEFDGYLVEPIDQAILSQILSLARTRRRLAESRSSRDACLARQ